MIKKTAKTGSISRRRLDDGWRRRGACRFAVSHQFAAGAKADVTLFHCDVRFVHPIYDQKTRHMGMINETQDTSRRNDRRRHAWADLKRWRSTAADHNRHEHAADRWSGGRRQGLA